ncbi:hypothetical protein E2P81_ATG10233 [Venturia nashicola]|nr:hypothetical protein E2P81_ATG10233 [Venturia nashicola]
MADASPAPKRMKYDLTKTFEVLVGKEPNQQRFTVHSGPAIERSEFFNAARSSRWTEPTKPTILDDHDPEIFSAYLHCLYFGAAGLKGMCSSSSGEARAQESATVKVRGSGARNHNLSSDTSSSDDDSDSESDGDSDSDSDGDSDSDSDSGSGSDGKAGTKDGHEISDVGKDQERSARPVNWLLFNLYTLADKLMDPTTANMVIDEIIRKLQQGVITPGLVAITHVYNSTLHGCPMRKLIRDWYIYKASYAWVDDLQEKDYPVQMIQDVLRETWKLRKKNEHRRVRDVFNKSYMSQPGTRYHQRVGKVPKRRTITDAEDQIKDAKKSG